MTDSASIPLSPTAAVTAAPVIARIAQIGVSDYRVFPGGPPYELKLGGRNLLLFGENGSGKTSLFRALRDLMAIKPGPENFEDLRNAFAPAKEGFVAVQLTVGGTNEFRWNYGEPHPRQTEGQPYALFAERCRFVDYRSLLETNYVHRGPTPNLYKLLVNDVLKDLPVIADGKQDRLGAVHARMLSAKPRNHRSKNDLNWLDRNCERFSAALANHLPEVVEEARRLLRKIGYPEMDFDLEPGTVQYDQVKRKFVGEEVLLSVTFKDQPIAQPQQFLNEARLTALALAIYLGSARLILSSPASGADGTTPVRLLVLDDLLIGLDLSNRLPVLRVLEEEFGDWQILLFTYDRVWFDLAREYTEHTDRWAYFRLREIAVEPGRVGIPCIEPCPDFLAIAEKQLQLGYLMAAAVYIRAAFESRLKNVCEKKGVQVQYNSQNITANALWEGIVARQKDRQSKRQKDFIDRQLSRDVETVRSTVLNRLSHSGTPTLVTSEVKFAFDTIKRLYQHQFT